MKTKTHIFIALLRGINVGGNNLIKMTALKACFENMGFANIITYIQSGNVIFTSTEESIEFLTLQIEKELTKTFNYSSSVVLIAFSDYEKVIEHAPPTFGISPGIYRYDVLFLKPPLKAKEAIQHVPVKEGVDTVFAGEKVLYFSRCIDKVTQSKLSRIIQLPIYQQMTIRNWNTTTKIYTLLQDITYS